jgi:Putative transposase
MLHHYLARYTHRVAISNHRLVAFKEDRVSFRWKDYAAGGKQEIMTVSADEFLRRFLIHVLPKGLVRIRHFGLFANCRGAPSLLRCRSLLGRPLSSQQPAPSVHSRCLLCSEPMLVVERMTCAQLHFRSTLTLPNTPHCGVDSS